MFLNVVKLKKVFIMYTFFIPIVSVLIGFLCGLVLNLVHILFSIYLQLKFCKFIFLKMVYNVKNYFTDTMKKDETENELIEKSVKSYPKIPKHLTFGMGEESISYDDLVQLIVWCLPTGVPVISFYDHKNELNADKLHDTFVRTHGDLAPCIKWGVSFAQDVDFDKYDKLPCLQVNVFTSKHSRQLLIESIKELSRKKDLKLENRASTEAALDDIMLSKFSYCGNPDLLVITGNVYTTYGLSPWHLGFTEFTTVPSYKLLTVYDFITILATYARCEQKFGR